MNHPENMIPEPPRRAASYRAKTTVEPAISGIEQMPQEVRRSTGRYYNPRRGSRLSRGSRRSRLSRGSRGRYRQRHRAITSRRPRFLNRQTRVHRTPMHVFDETRRTYVPMPR